MVSFQALWLDNQHLHSDIVKINDDEGIQTFERSQLPELNTPLNTIELVK